MTYLELLLRKAIQLVYPDSKLEWCYFHFSKALWRRAKKLGLISIKNIDK